MIIVSPTTAPEWDSTDAARLKEFLYEDPAGKKLLPWLAYLAPEFEDGTNGNKTLVASGVVQGYQEAVKNLVSLISVNPKENLASPNYPSLEDDSAWKEPENK